MSVDHLFKNNNNNTLNYTIIKNKQNSANVNKLSNAQQKVHQNLE